MADRPAQRGYDPAEESGWGSPMPAEYGSLTTFLPPLDDPPERPPSNRGPDEAERERAGERPAAPRRGERNAGGAAAAPRGEGSDDPPVAARRPDRRWWSRKAAPGAETPQHASNGASADNHAAPVWAAPAVAAAGPAGLAGAETRAAVTPAPVYQDGAGWEVAAGGGAKAGADTAVVPVSPGADAAGEGRVAGGGAASADTAVVPVQRDEPGGAGGRTAAAVVGAGGVAAGVVAAGGAHGADGAGPSAATAGGAHGAAGAVGAHGAAGAGPSAAGADTAAVPVVPTGPGGPDGLGGADTTATPLVADEFGRNRSGPGPGQAPVTRDPLRPPPMTAVMPVTAIPMGSPSEEQSIPGPGQQGQTRDSFGSRRRQRQAARPQWAQSQRTVRHLNVWTVFKVSLAFYFMLLVAVVVASVLLWYVADAFGSIQTIEKSVKTLFDLSKFTIHPSQVAKYTSIGGGILALCGTFANVLAGFMYNLISDLVGGIRFDVVDEGR